MQGYEDRDEAGRTLAAELERFKDASPLILALPRGGLPVAEPIARSLGAPVDVLPVAKLGVPGQEELAMGAVAEGGGRVLNEDVITQLRIEPQRVDQATEAQRQKLQRQAADYRGERGPLSVQGRTVILVDDGLATGASMRAAARAASQRQPAKTVIAAPVGDPQVVELMAQFADEVVCPFQPQPLGGVGRWYRRFDPVSDEEVRRILAENRPDESVS